MKQLLQHVPVQTTLYIHPTTLHLLLRCLLLSDAWRSVWILLLPDRTQTRHQLLLQILHASEPQDHAVIHHMHGFHHPLVQHPYRSQLYKLIQDVIQHLVQLWRHLPLWPHLDEQQCERRPVAPKICER